MTVIFHVGTPKSATSTLQAAFFPNLNGALFLGKHVDRAAGREFYVNERINHFIHNVSNTYRDYVADPGLANHIRDLASDKQTIILSDESFCVFSGVDPLTKIERMCAALAPFAPFKVILAARDQISLWKSDYLTQHRSEMLRHPGYEKAWYPNFDQFISMHFRYAHGAVLESYRYATLLRDYAQLFGRNHVMAYAFEDFKSSPHTILASMADFIGVEVPDAHINEVIQTRENTHYSARTYSYNTWRKRLLGDAHLGWLVPHRLHRRLRTWMANGGYLEVTMSPDTLRRLTDYYADDNAQLKAEWGISL